MKKCELAIVCFSGGHSSALTAIETVRKYGKNNVILLNHDISGRVEHQDIKRFKEDVSNYCDVPITYANAENFEEMTPLEVCKRKASFSAGTHQAFCTYELKTKPFYDYLKSIDKSPKVHIIYGFDADEEDRIYRRSTKIMAMGYTADFPLAYWDRTIEKTTDVKINPPSTYRIFKHANCIGCLKAGRQHWYCVYCLRPDIFEEAKQAEDEIGYSVINGCYMKELEEKFHEMKYNKSICPTQQIEPAAFWAKVENTLPEQTSFMPCDCSY